MLFDHTVRDLLQRASSIAIVGAKDKAGSPVDRVGRYLLTAGYTLFPVHPVRKSAWGLPAVPSLAHLPGPVDIICLFRASQYCADHAREVLVLPWKPAMFWMQEGISSREAGIMMAQAGIQVVEDLCIKTEHARLLDIPGSPTAEETGTVIAAAVPAAPPIPQGNTALFSCKRCGHCCHGEGGIVVSPKDLSRMADYLDLDPPIFLRRYTRSARGKDVLISNEDGWCVFFQPGIGCGVHAARPDVCRAWPYFRGNLLDEVSFAMAKSDCPGIDPDADHARFAEIGFAYLHHHKLLTTDNTQEGNALSIHEYELPGKGKLV